MDFSGISGVWCFDIDLWLVVVTASDFGVLGICYFGWFGMVWVIWAGAGCLG